jgi:hypothetical protein
VNHLLYLLPWVRVLFLDPFDHVNHVGPRDVAVHDNQCRLRFRTALTSITIPLSAFPTDVNQDTFTDTLASLVLR